jgi:hypothetical protein
MKCSIQSGLRDINIVANTWRIHGCISLLANSASGIEIDLSLLYKQAHDVLVRELPLDGYDQQWIGGCRRGTAWN